MTYRNIHCACNSDKGRQTGQLASRPRAGAGRFYQYLSIFRWNFALCLFFSPSSSSPSSSLCALSVRMCAEKWGTHWKCNINSCPADSFPILDPLRLGIRRILCSSSGTLGDRFWSFKGVKGPVGRRDSVEIARSPALRRTIKCQNSLF